MTFQKNFLASAVLALLFLQGHVGAALIAHYNFNETAGPTLSDSVGTAHGTTTDVTFAPSGAGVLESGFGNAGVFNGSTSKVEFSKSATFDLGTSDFTIAGWFKTPSNELAHDRIVFHNQSFASGGWSFEIRRADRGNRGQIYFTVGGPSFVDTQAFSDSHGRVDDDEWHWVAAVVDGTSVTMYVDGVLQNDTGTRNANHTATSSAATIPAFGVRPSVTPLESQLDSWSIYNHALSRTVDANNVLIGGELFDLWQVPEPATSVLMGMSVALAFMMRRISK